MKKRSLLVLMVVALGLGIRPHGGVPVSLAASDTQTLETGSVMLGHRTVHRAEEWLRHQPAVASARLGRDGQTLDILFRDGQRAEILPRSFGNVRLPATFISGRLRPQDRMQAPGARALILEPFAAQLGLGPNAGDAEVNYLRSAGFAVDQIYDEKVTVNSLRIASSYNVTYIHTHSGTNAGGEGVVATGQPVNGDPGVAPLMQNGSVISVAISGSKQTYYGITSSFVKNYFGIFPTNSLLFLNGCNMLSAPVFWLALQSKNLGAMVSWDKEATSRDNFLSGGAFFAEMSQGMTVAAAIVAEKAAGYGTSTVNGEKTTLGYLGDGSITLQKAAAGSPPNTPTPGPTLTPTPPKGTATPTATPAPTPTNTSVPGPPLSLDLKARVDPGSRQVIRITSSPDAIVHIFITFPSGDTRSQTTATDGAGIARFVFPQHPSRIAYQHVFASVRVEVIKNGGITTLTKLYRIGWGYIDAAVEPRTQAVGKRITIWIHSTAGAQIDVTLHFPVGSVKKLRTTTGRDGWARLPYTVGRYLKKPGKHTVGLTATVTLGGKLRRAVSSFTIT